MRRRELLASGAGLALYGLEPALGLESASIECPEHLILDVRLADAQQFAETMPNTVIHCMSGDVTPLWQDQLQDICQRAVDSVAGCTRHSECFVLTTLAREFDYRLANSKVFPDHVHWLLVPANLRVN